MLMLICTTSYVLKIIYSEYSLICRNSFSMNLVDQLDNHWYLYIILVLGNCGGLKGLADEAVAD